MWVFNLLYLNNHQTSDTSYFDTDLNKEVFIGPRGGKYYFNSHTNKKLVWEKQTSEMENIPEQKARRRRKKWTT